MPKLHRVEGRSDIRPEPELRPFGREHRRMRYVPDDRRLVGVGPGDAVFYPCGVVEGGCRHIVGARLEQVGMCWTIHGANATIALRCAIESNRFDDFWKRRAATAS